MDQTLALIKPHAFAKANKIERRIMERGLNIVQSKAATVQLTRNEVGDFYAARKGSEDFEELKKALSAGPMRALVLEGPAAIATWLSLIGPAEVLVAKSEDPSSVRAEFGDESGGAGLDAVHGSADFIAAEREIRFFFPQARGDNSAGESIEAFLASEVTPLLTEALAELVTVSSLSPARPQTLDSLNKVRPAKPIPWLARWLADHSEIRSKNQATST